MPIYLMRHADNTTSEVNADKPLTEKGVHQTQSVATQAMNYIPKLNKIRHSNKLRAIQTATHFKALYNPKLSSLTLNHLSPNSEPDELIPLLNTDSNELFISHLPLLDKLCALLLTNNENKWITQFQHASLFCLNKLSTSEQWTISWALKPTL